MSRPVALAHLHTRAPPGRSPGQNPPPLPENPSRERRCRSIRNASGPCEPEYTHAGWDKRRLPGWRAATRAECAMADRLRDPCETSIDCRAPNGHSGAPGPPVSEIPTDGMRPLARWRWHHSDLVRAVPAENDRSPLRNAVAASVRNL